MKNHQINPLQDLQTARAQEWQAVPHALIQQYVDSMRRRIMEHTGVKLVVRQDVGIIHNYFHEKQS